MWTLGCWSWLSFLHPGRIEKLKKFHLPSSLCQACILHTLGSSPFPWALWGFAEQGWPGHTNPTAEQQWQLLWVSPHSRSGCLTATFSQVSSTWTGPASLLPPFWGSMAEGGSWGARTLQPRQQDLCPCWAAALCTLVGCAFQCGHLLGLQLSCAGTRQPHLLLWGTKWLRFSAKEGNTLPVLMGTCKKWTWVCENKKLQKALEHLWFELTLQRKSCSFLKTERCRREVHASQSITIARAGIQHVVEVTQASDDGNNQKLQLWQEESLKYYNRVRSETEKYGQVSTGVLTKQYTGATSAPCESYRTSTELCCLGGAGQTNSLKLTRVSLISACPKAQNLCYKHWY